MQMKGGQYIEARHHPSQGGGPAADARALQYQTLAFNKKSWGAVFYRVAGRRTRAFHMQMRRD
jgi:hypothetical protein